MSVLNAQGKPTSGREALTEAQLVQALTILGQRLMHSEQQLMQIGLLVEFLMTKSNATDQEFQTFAEARVREITEARAQAAAANNLNLEDS